MDTFIILRFVNNAALLMAIGLIYSILPMKHSGPKPLWHQLTVCLSLGIVGIGIMLNAWEFMPGVFFDARSVLLSVTGLFFGAAPACVAMAMTGAYRFIAGGAGTWTGIGLIVTSGMIGLAWRRWRKAEIARISSLELYAFGLMTHAVMLSWMLLLPRSMAMSAISRIGWATLFVFPAATVLLGKMIQFHHSRIAIAEAFQKSERHARLLNRRLKTLQQAISRLAGAKRLADVTRITRKAARTLIGADGATFILRKNDRCHYVDEDAIGPLWKGQDFPMECCVSGWVIQHNQPVIIEDIYADERVPIDSYRPTFVKSIAMVPIATAEPLGAIGIYWATRKTATREEMELLSALADAVAVAIENIHSYRLLEQRAAKGTAELEAANRANKELDAFSYSVSHDLRAPLRAIGGYTRILMEDHSSFLDAEGKRICTVISNSAKEMGKLITDLLILSRVSRTDLKSSPIDMTTLANSIFWELTTHENRERIDFQVEPLPRAMGDPVLIRQVWMNLLSNALKFSARKQQAIICVASETEENEVVFSIRDNGAGFDMCYANKLFGVFQRLHSTKMFEGTGVGLAIVQRIIHRHGGRVWAKGEKDHGAVFYFTLPTGDPK